MLRIIVLFTLLGTLVAGAQVPQLISYQGRIVTGEVNFDGTGQFKFALVNGDGSVSYWSNDGTSVAGSEPSDAIPLAVSKGLYSVLLGDASLTNMSVIPSTVFANSEVFLRVWFDDGTNGSQLLTPDQRIAAVGYAMMAASVADGSVTAAKLAPDAAADNLAASGQSGVPAGGIVLSADENPALVSAGYLRIGSVTIQVDGWKPGTNSGAPSPRRGHTAVWTGTEMIVWGGFGSSFLGDGGRYNPNTDSWSPLAAAGAPAPRSAHSAVWTGTEMIVWGGWNGTRLGDGARYDPQSDSWTPVGSVGAPSVRSSHSGVWTGSEMIVWAGFDGARLNDGARYNPVNDSWAPVQATAAPSVRAGHSTVWTGSEMIVWGGFDGGSYLIDGGRYDPVADSWSSLAAVGAPSIRFNQTAVWSGSEMIVWGGRDSNGGTYWDDGARYDPANDVWLSLQSNGAPSGRQSHKSVWANDRMLVWGGEASTGNLSDGGLYDPGDDTWAAAPVSGQPSARDGHTMVWTGSEAIIWGGHDGIANQNDLFRYNLPTVMHLYQRQ